MKAVITRFAPSPTGRLHLGNVRTAVLNWLYAHKHGGRFLLRFEDTDQDRSEQQYITGIEEDLVWLGLNWDDNVRFQSQHAGNHREALQRLANQGLAYRCFCTESQINLDRKLAASRGLPPRYSGSCKGISVTESAAKAEQQAFVWRLAVHSDSEDAVVVPDLLRGDVRFSLHDLDDPVIVRSDGSFTFLLPNALDDALDGITHVLRGDDHLTNTAYQIWLLDKLGLAAPAYFHHGLLLSADGVKLSKRTGSHSIAELRDAGISPQAIIQAMARLGHPNMDEQELGLDGLARAFEAEKLSTSAVRWLDDTMWRWHIRILHEMPAAELAPLLAPHLPPVDEKTLLALAELVRGNLDRVEQAKDFVRLVDATVLDSQEGFEVARMAGEGFFRQALALWQAVERQDWKAWTAAVGVASGSKGKALFMPLRVALTGCLHGPDMGSVIDFLGRDGVSCRLNDMLERVV